MLLNKLIKNSKKYNINYVYNHNYWFFKKFKKLKNSQINNQDSASQSLPVNFFSFKISNNFYIKKIFNKFKNKNKNHYKISNPSLTFFDINFLRKEKIYTKLKYSRVPQYDIVSGGSAALFAGFLGFLICEKFGFELLDSGDFYFLFMYMVFFFFLSRLFFKLLDFSKTN